MTTQTSTENIRTELTAVFREVFDDPAITLRDEMTAADVEAWDSLNHFALIIAVERTFRIRLTLAEIQRLDNVGALIKLIQLKVPAA